MKKFLIKGLVYFSILSIGALIGYKVPKLLWGKAESNLNISATDNKDVSLNDLSGIYISDTNNSSNSSEIIFHIESEEEPVQGKFNDFLIVLNAHQDFTQSEITVSINTKSLFTDNDYRDKSLLDVDFFNVETYPEILFTSHAVANLPCNDTLDYISTGKLQMLGVNKHLDIQFNLVGTGENDAGKEIAIFKGGFTFNRTQFGMPEYEGIADNVFVEFTTELTKQ